MDISKGNEKSGVGFCSEYSGYYELGNSYFWIAAHYDIVMEHVTPLLKTAKRTKRIIMLDAGCGQGSMFDRLENFGKIIGLDVTEEACQCCYQKYHGRVTQARVENAPFADNTFDFIFAIETIEHVKNDLQALKELYRILKPKGFLVATVPAFMCLWGYHDEKYGHMLRYTKGKFSEKAKQAGFTVREAHYVKFILFLPLLVMRKLKRLTHCEADDFYKISPPVNNLLHKLLNVEIPVASVVDFPVGANIFTILYKK